MVAERYAATEAVMKDRSESVLPVTRQIIGKAEQLSAADTFKGFYRLRDLKWTAEPMLAGIDMLCVPTVAVAIVGAHMRGLPLNDEVTRLGGRFLYEGATAPEYRLYALAGGGAHAARASARGAGGASIALEGMGDAAVALRRIRAGIPSPLGIGTVRPASDDTVKGFLCERRPRWS